jgi:signal transduction histidine kinase
MGIALTDYLRTRLARLDSLSLSMRFALTGSVVMIVAAVVTGYWLTNVISRGVVSNTAGATALFMDSFIGPLAQELDTADVLPIGPTRAMEELLEGSAFGKRVISVKLWKPGGLIAYAEDENLIGRRFPVSAGLEKAFAGSIVSELDELDEDESAGERNSGLPLLEVYSPIREVWTGRIIAVAEFYEDATALRRTLRGAVIEAWLLVAALMLMIGSALFGIVHRASRVIEDQRQALRDRMVEAVQASEQNRQLRVRVERAAGRAAELNERFLRRVGADLHDGPAQLISLAALKLSGIARAPRKSERLAEAQVVKGALDDAMREIRGICGGLSLPEIESKSLETIITGLVHAHERLTSTTVSVQLDLGTAPVSEALKICVFRFVQEGLSNAFRHASGIGQRIEAFIKGNTLTVALRNGPANGGKSSRNGTGLGLAGLRERVESLGGRFSFDAPEGREVTMAMRVYLRGADDE